MAIVDHLKGAFNAIFKSFVPTVCVRMRELIIMSSSAVIRRHAMFSGEHQLLAPLKETIFFF